MSMDFDLKSPPSYQQSLPSGQSILQQLSSVRSQHIKYVVSSQILPILSQRASIGISKTAIALIPNNILPANSRMTQSTGSHSLNSFDTGSQASQLEGLANTDESCEEVNLSEPMDTHQFWEQSEVLDTLRSILENELATSSLFSPSPSADEAYSQSELPPRPEKAPRSFSLFGRKPTPKPQAPSLTKKPAPSIKVCVGLEEVCYRTCSDFGLYETISRPAVIIRVETR
jgi:hypothetical protein